MQLCTVVYDMHISMRFRTQVTYDRLQHNLTICHWTEPLSSIQKAKSVYIHVFAMCVSINSEDIDVHPSLHLSPKVGQVPTTWVIQADNSVLYTHEEVFTINQMFHGRQRRQEVHRMTSLIEGKVFFCTGSVWNLATGGGAVVNIL